MEADLLKKTITILMLLCFTFMLAACGGEEPNIVSAGEDNTATGQKGDVMRTPQIDFVVSEVRALSKFADQRPIDGDKYIDVLISITNTSDVDIEMHDVDFQLQWGAAGFADPMVAYDERMAPFDFAVAAGETVEYHFIYSVSAQITQFKICYLHKPVGEERPQLLYVEFSL